jgi:hypothetical protein
MRRSFFTCSIALLSLAACTGSPTPTNDAETRDVANTDALLIDAHLDTTADTASDLPAQDVTPDTTPVADVVSDGDASASTECAYGNCACVDPSVCDNRVELVPGEPLTMQDTATGGFGDCSHCASCSGGKNLYYRLSLSPGHVTRVHATPNSPSEDLLVRTLSDCSVDATTIDSARGGDLTMGSATLCLRNDATDTQSVIVAVGLYGGTRPTVMFDLTAEVLDPADSCL